ncbi:MAG: hypothetical protein IPL67_01480 [Ignavibacteria bacterium]|nr:hypothetical protein [Ignavibacteria bacterium]
MESGKWKNGNGKWKVERKMVENGKWKVENGKWKMESGADVLAIQAC